MLKDKIRLIRERYESIHPEPEQHADAIESLAALYDEFAAADGVPPLSELQKQGLGEYYRMMYSTGAPYYVMVEAIYRFRKKAPCKRDFSYFIGMLKTWRTYGITNSPSTDHRKLNEILEFELGIHLSPGQHDELSGILTTYGGVSVGYAVGRLTKRNFAREFMESLRKTLKVPETSADPQAVVASREPEAPQRTYEELPSETPVRSILEESRVIEGLLQHRCSMSRQELKVEAAKVLQLPKETIDQRFEKYLKVNRRIIRVGRHEYALAKSSPDGKDARVYQGGAPCAL